MTALDSLNRHVHCCASAALYVILAMLIASLVTAWIMRSLAQRRRS